MSFSTVQDKNGKTRFPHAEEDLHSASRFACSIENGMRNTFLNSAESMTCQFRCQKLLSTRTKVKCLAIFNYLDWQVISQHRSEIYSHWTSRVQKDIFHTVFNGTSKTTSGMEVLFKVRETTFSCIFILHGWIGVLTHVMQKQWYQNIYFWTMLGNNLSVEVVKNC